MCFNKKSKIVLFFLIIGVLGSWLLSGCKGDFLNTAPEDQVSESVFWSSRADAQQALMGCYRIRRDINGWDGFTGWNVGMGYFSDWTDIATNARRGENPSFPTGGIEPTNSAVNIMWDANYRAVGIHNYFLENINKVEMDDDEKAEMIAEVKFLRAYAYFWLSQLYGNVPLITEILTFDEANSVDQASQEEVVNFAVNELTEAAEILPIERPSSEKGRIEKGAALALKGRFLMAEQRWSDAANAYNELIDLDRYSIDPRFKELFEDEGDDSNEIIFARQYIEGPELGEATTNFHMVVGTFGGTSGLNFTQSFVDKFLMTDGSKPNSEESGLYDPDNPFEDRDPRLYDTVLLPSYSEVNGKIYHGHPDTIALSGQTGPGVTGYSWNKFWDHDYEGNPQHYGGDYPLIRYAEVLLSYLESRLEAGDNITQSLLDRTINRIRGRDAVQMPPVIETNPNELRQIIRDERAIEFAAEGGIRYWDLVRWDRATEVIGQRFYGMKITDNPEEYDGTYIVNDRGHIFIVEKTFEDHNSLWPIPQSELDVNPNLEQNPGY